MQRLEALPARGPRTVRAELGVLFRAIALLTFLVLLCNAAPRLYLLERLHPRVASLHRTQQQVQLLHSATVDEETGLRGYLATGARRFLDPYATAIPRAAQAEQALRSQQNTSAISADLVAMQVAQQRWFDEWARTAADPSEAATTGLSPTGPNQQALLTAFLSQGKALFDAYRETEKTLATDINAELARADKDENDWFLWTGVLQIVMATVLVLVTLASSRRLRRLIAQPVASLAGTVARIKAGDLSARVTPAPAPTELVALTADVDEMAEALQRQAALADQREAEAHRYARRLAVVLDAAREIAGSLSLRYILEAVTEAACNVGGDRARAWLTDEDGRNATLAIDSAVPRKRAHVIENVQAGEGLVGRVLKLRRSLEVIVEDGTRTVAVPMIIGARLVGVLECQLQPMADDGDATSAVHVLEALAGHAAASLESARLHEQTREASLTDALTGLANRRAFDHDLDVEVRRAQRYERPLSVIYADLDHFKALNDTYGHRSGDIALQQAASTLREGLRESDRIYRVGGEELVVIAPETSAEQAAVTAERLRQAIEEGAPAGSPRITASFGVAELPGNALDGAGLLRAADRALYAAKAAGRNCVVVSADPGATPVPVPRAAASGG